jgi:oligopeptide transport system ATP-binding protein
MALLRLLGQNAIIKNGSAIFDGSDLLKLEVGQLNKIRGDRIAMIFQDPMTCLNPLMKVGEQVAEVLLEHNPGLGKAAAKKHVIELFSQARIPTPDRRYGSYPHEFSGGMRQRAMIAMALACNPDIIIADEPTTALDVTIQAQIVRLLKNLQDERNISIIFITHDLGVVAEICTKIIVMYGGRILEEGSAEEIYEQPSHPYTLGLMAAVPRVDQDREKPLDPIPGSPPDMLSPPAGCPFCPRCPYARNICLDEMPPEYAISRSHKSRCFLHDAGAPAENNPFSPVKEAAL